MSRRWTALLLGAVVAFVTFAPGIGVHAASGDKELSRVKGTVGYEPTDKGPFNPVFGRTDLPDNAYAVTQARSLALLRLRDSSEIEIGEQTLVRVGEFNAVQSGKDNEIVLDHGALHFKIRHPQGARANYTFQTPTSQIAVRGSEGYIIQGSAGTLLICIECAPGDVLLRIGAQVNPVTTNQTATIRGTNPSNATFTVEQGVPQFGSIAQFNPGMTPLGVDPTGYTLAATQSAVGGLLTTLGVIGGVAGTIAVANGAPASNPTPGPTPFQPTPTPVPTATPTPSPTATPTPSPTATPTPSPTASPVGTPTPTPSPSPTPTPSPTPSPSASPTPSPTPAAGALTVNPTTLSFDGVPSTQSFTVSQQAGGGTITIAQPNCGNTGAAASDSPNSAPADGSTSSISVTAQAAPTQSPPPQYACTITVTGVGNQTQTVYLNIRSTNVGVSSKQQGATPSSSPTPTPGGASSTTQPAPSARPTPAPKPAPAPISHPIGH